LLERHIDAAKNLFAAVSARETADFKNGCLWHNDAIITFAIGSSQLRDRNALEQMLTEDRTARL